jgi:formylglycine-generating enzyme required for sulfatase activity/serine/threonine protein kinase
VQIPSPINTSAALVDAATVLPTNNPPTGSSAPPRARSELSRSEAAREGKPEDQLLRLLSPPEAPGEIGRLGCYRVLKVLGAGGMGAVFQAEDPVLKRQVALKVMLPGLVTSESHRLRFLREAQAAAAVSHDHVVAIFQVGEANGIPFLAMPLLQGESLESAIKRHAPLSLSDILRIGRETAEGLAAAHARGLIHRDIKPANLWLEEMPPRAGEEGSTFRVKILDFGLARETSGGRALTQVGAILGTPGYMAPEQANGQPMDSRCDLFSLGCVLYRVATGRPAFRGQDVLAALLAVATENPLPPAEVSPGLPAGLSALIMQLLEKDPAKRRATAAAVAAALAAIEREVAAGMPVRQEPAEGSREDWTHLAKSPPDEPAPAPEAYRTRAMRPPRKRGGAGGLSPLGWALVAGGGVGVLVVLGAVLLLSSGNDNPGGPAREKRPASLTAGTGGLEAAVTPPGKAEPKQEEVKLWGEEIESSIGMKLVRIPAGTFLMGSPAAEEGRDNKEVQHTVEISRDFWLGVHEVTQKQYQMVMGANPSWFSAAGGGKDQVAGMNTDDFPVERVTWNDAVTFCNKLSAAPEERKAGRKYRLPSEAEWERACRGGAPASQPFHFGNALSSKQANSTSDMALGRTCKVGSYPKNAFGLHDMHGNVWEWCSDWHNPDYYGKSPRRDPQGHSRGAFRVIRGGGWDNTGLGCRSAIRNKRRPANPNFNVGFRVALGPADR